MRSEAIDYLLRNNMQVTESNIASIIDDNFNSKSVSSIVDKTRGINNDFIEDVYKYTVSEVSPLAERRKLLDSKISNTIDFAQDKIESILANIRQGLVDISIAHALERNASGFIDTLNIDLNNQAIINKENTNSSISDNVIYGIQSNNSFADKSFVKTKPYGLNNIKYSSYDTKGLYDIKLENTENSIPTVFNNGSHIINSDAKFRLVSSANNSNQKVFEVIIDRQNNDVFNQFEISLKKACLGNVFLSNDGKTYSKVFPRNSYIKNTVLPVGKSNSRYIKLVFFVNKPARQKSGMFEFVLEFNFINILQSTIGNKSFYETNNIDFPGVYSGLSISTCDNFSDENINIKYFVSINNSDWKPIRPVDKVATFKSIEPTVIKINDYFDNKIISLTDITKVNDRFESKVLIPKEFIFSNQISVFSEDISKTSIDWAFDGARYCCNALLVRPSTIDFGPNPIEINGRLLSGSVALPSGLYSIKTEAHNYANIINFRTVNVVSVNGPEYTVKDEEGTLRTVLDPLFPYNHKIVCDNAFDFIFGSQLFEKYDYSLYNNGTDYIISMPVEHKEVLICYRLQKQSVSTVKVKAEMESLDKVTIPYIERILIRAN